MSRSRHSPWPYLALAIAAATAGCSPGGADPGKAPAAATQSATPEALCKHEVADRFCPLCHPEIRQDPDLLLCKEHENIPEEICTACHPELKAKGRFIRITTAGLRESHPHDVTGIVEAPNYTQKG